MNLLFVLYRYFPYGGLQRDMLSIATRCYERGHNVSVFTTDWDGDIPRWLNVCCRPVSGRSNHQRMLRFGRQVMDYAAEGNFDQVVGFNKLPGLDTYYAADGCYQERARRLRSWFYRLTPRYRTYIDLESSVFTAGQKTSILMIAKPEIPVYRQYYATEPERMIMLPPGVRRDRIMPADYPERRKMFRAQLGLGDQDRLVLMVGSGFRSKGLDRSLKAVASLPAQLLKLTRFVVVGEHNNAPFTRMIKRLGITDQVEFVGGRNDVEYFLWAADLLIHPAYTENTGTVLLEAMTAGLPILTTAVCGYASYVKDWHMGVVLEEPFSQAQLNRTLSQMLETQDRQKWETLGRRFATEEDIFSMADRAVSEIEALGVAR